MSLVCGKISADIQASCTSPLVTGTRDKMWLFNFEDVAGYSESLTNKLIIEDMTMVATKVGYEIVGLNNSNRPTSGLNVGTFVNQWDHQVQFLGFDISPATKENLESMKDGLFIAIVENVSKGATGNTAFEVYGLDAGLKMTQLVRDPNNAETQGAFDIILSNPKNKEPYMPRTFFDTDYATTLANITALL